MAALAANLAIAIAKFVAFLLTGSASMLAEAVHSVADTGNEMLLLIGGGRSRRARTTEHPFGFGRERYFYAFVVAVMLFTVGAVFSLYDGIHKIINPGHLDSPIVAYIVLGVSMVLEYCRCAPRSARRTWSATGRGWRPFVHLTKIPELPVVLLEDSAALIGLTFAFLGVLLSQLTGHDEWDGAGSIGVGLLLAGAAFIVGYETKSLLIGESATEEVSGQIVSALESGPEEFRLIHMRTSHIGPESLLVAAKIGVRGTQTAAELAAGIDAAEKRIRASVPIAEIIYLEPDIYHPGQEDVSDPSVAIVRRTRKRPRSRAAPDPVPRTRPLPPRPEEPPRATARRLIRAAARLRTPTCPRLSADLPNLSDAGRRARGGRVPSRSRGHGRRRAGRHVAGAAAEVGDRRAGRGVGEHAQPERECGRRDVVPLLDPERGDDRGQVLVGELPVRGTAPGWPVPQRRQQPKILPVAEHPG